jgi:hypothetical protein
MVAGNGTVSWGVGTEGEATFGISGTTGCTLLTGGVQCDYEATQWFTLESQNS